MRKYLFYTMILILFLVPVGVFAQGERVCVSNNLYEIVQKGSKVNLNTLTKEQIDAGTQNPADSEYRFQATSLGQKCVVTKQNSDGSSIWKSCPLYEQYGKQTSLYNMNNLQSAMSTFQFNGSGGFYVDIKDKFNSTLLVRVVRSGGQLNENGNDLSSAQGLIRPNEVYDLKSSGLRLSFGAAEKVTFEFYISPSSGVDCAGSYLGNIQTTTPKYALVDNPLKNSATCQAFRNDKEYAYIPTSPTNYKALLVPDCYKDKIDYFSERVTEASIQSKIESIKRTFQPSTDAEVSKLQCHYHEDGSREVSVQTKSYFLNPGGGTSSNPDDKEDYWAASCKETVTITYDQPKKVIAGTGFPYDATIEVSRTCTPMLIRTSFDIPKCEYDVECWNGPNHYIGSDHTGAGPNEEFDSCINTCDGGKYTKDCIQKCYERVYEGKTVDFSSKKQLSNQFIDVIKAKQMLQPEDKEEIRQYNLRNCIGEKQKDSPNYCYERNNWPQFAYYLEEINGNYDTVATSKIQTPKPSESYIYEVVATTINSSRCDAENYMCTTFHGTSFPYAAGCEKTQCYEVYVGKPRPYCSDNPELDGGTYTDIALDEYNDLLKFISNYEDTEKFEMSIVDSYKRDNKGHQLITTSTSDANQLKITKEILEPETISTEEKTIGGNKLEIPTIKVTKRYKVELPQAVINQVTGQEKYVKNGYQILATERDGGNKYYTDLQSGTYNDYRKWINNYSPLDERPDTPYVGNNISVVFKQVGTAQSETEYTWNTITLDCFYGIINKHNIDCDDGVCDDPDNPLICDDGDICTGGLQYMFRQIDTTNMFPNRAPRWNWTYTTEKDQYGYASDPAKVREDVQALGDSVYDQEPDYEISLTRANIRAIRGYNRRQNNYQNYDMECYLLKNGVQVCESRMFKEGYVKTFSRNTDLGSND